MRVSSRGQNMGTDMGNSDDNVMRQGRITALVIAGSISLWLIIQWIGPLIGLAGRYAILADLAVMAALIWALINCFFIWRKR